MDHNGHFNNNFLPLGEGNRKQRKGARVAYLHTNYLWQIVAIELWGKCVG